MSRAPSQKDSRGPFGFWETEVFPELMFIEYFPCAAPGVNHVV